MSFELLNKAVLATAHDLSPNPIPGTIIGCTNNAIAVRLEFSLMLPNHVEAAYLVASIRHENKSLMEINSGQQVLCALTPVPTANFDPAKPCDLSWWRGGGAAIGDIVLASTRDSR
jgi:hypothetical protein